MKIRLFYISILILAINISSSFSTDICCESVSIFTQRTADCCVIFTVTNPHCHDLGILFEQKNLTSNQWEEEAFLN